MTVTTSAGTRPTQVHFGKALQHYLEVNKRQNGVSYTFVAQKVGMSLVQLSKLQSQAYFSPSTQARVCNAFGIDILEFLEKGAI